MNLLNRLSGWLLVGAAWLIFTGPLWFSAGNAYLGDLAWVDVPMRVFAGRAIRAGRFPFWIEELAAGMPVLAESQTGLAYPPFWLFVLCPFPKANDWFLSLHYLLLGVGAFLLARQAGARPVSAATAAVLLMTCWMARILHFASPILAVYSWLPLTLWLIGQHYRGWRGTGWLAAVTWCFALLAGAINLAVTTTPLCLAYALYLGWHRGWAERARSVLVWGALPVLLAAVQIVPLFGYFRESNRRDQASRELAAGSGVPWHLFLPWGVLVPEPQNLEAPPVAAAPGRLAYGFTAIALLASVRAIRRRRDAWFWAAATGALLLLAVETPLLSVFNSLPPFSWFRFAGFYVMGALCCSSVLAALGLSQWEALLCDRRQGGRTLGRWVFLGLIFLGLGASLWAADMRNYLSDGPFYRHAHAALIDDVMDCTSRGRHARLLGPDVTGRLGDGTQNWRESQWRDMAVALAPSYNLLHSVPSINYHLQFAGTVANKRLYELGLLLWKDEPNALRAAAISHISKLEDQPPAGYKRIESDQGFAYRCSEDRPLAWMVYDAEVRSDWDAQRQRLTEESFDPYQTALVEKPLFGLGPRPAEAPRIDVLPGRASGKELRVNTENPGLLVMSYTYLAQLEALVDDAKTPIVPVNHAFCGIVVPSGTHRVALRYRLGEIVAGAMLSCLGLAITAALFVRDFRPQRSGVFYP